MTATINLLQIKEHGLNLDQYFGLWSVEESHFMQLFRQVSNFDLAAHVEQGEIGQQDPSRVETSKSNVIALVDINGTLTKRGSSFSRAGGMVYLKRQIRQLANDSDIAGIVLQIDSPGGTVAGTADLAVEVASAREKKPVYAFCEDLTASAAYWIASQCTKVFANNKTAMIGSVGTYVGLYDLSGMAEKEGIKAIVIKSTDLKGAGFPGAEITEQQISVWQELIDKTQSQFTQGVSSGRSISIAEAEKLATGRVYVAEDALSLGMIDEIASFEIMLADLQKEIAGKSKNQRRSTVTTEEKPEKQPASVAEVQAACPDADANFVVDCLKKGLTIEEAKGAYIVNLQEQLKMRDTELAEAKTKGAKKPGVDATLNDDGQSGTQQSHSGDDFESQVRELCDKGVTRRDAVKRVARQDPDAHQEYLLSMNGDPDVQKKIRQRQKYV
ncbi:MAG: S49 family peptidase [Planctomycetaceae bacterium]|nr:S49 family peptidase [Planctomycetaceae bacterium]